MTIMAKFNDILARHQLKYPIEVVPIANELGINVFKVKGFPNNISGRIYRSESEGGNSGYAIDVNANHPDTRRRFTISHEISHYVLHRGQIGEGLSDDYLYRSGLSNAVEAQANKLAANIMMPRHLLRKANNDGLYTVSELAKAFWVSEAAMSIRLGIPT